MEKPIEEQYKSSLEYINSYWNTIILKPDQKKTYLGKFLKKQDKKKLLTKNDVLDIPKSFLVPNDKKFKYIYYWDSYFMMRGLIGTKNQYVIKDMVENFAYLFKKYHIIPNFNSHASTGRSQPPFFTSMIMDAYKYHMHNSTAIANLKHSVKKVLPMRVGEEKWLLEMYHTSVDEYETVWMNNQEQYYHTVKGYELNRYGDRDIGYAHSSELESGWDFTSRFYNRCNDFLPVDLNTFLYKYEMDFSTMSHILQTGEEDKWLQKASKRKAEINKYMWNDEDGFFFDYGHHFNRISNFYSLAGYTPLWNGLATPLQASRMIKKLPLFETVHGLIITSKDSLAPDISLAEIPLRYRPALREILDPKQWDYPHIWPPLEYMTVIGLLKYGYVDDATRIMKNSLKTQANVFSRYHTFFEKINGVTGDIPKDFHYTTQTGFGWTNAIFYRYVQILKTLEQGIDIYQNPKPQEPPYELSIVY